MMNTLRFACTSLIGRNKAGLLPVDENGYREMIVGGLNVFNAANQYYPLEGVQELFDPAGSLMRRIKRGVLRAEYGHPKQDRMTNNQFINRVLNIDERMVCGHHAELWLDFEAKGQDGKPYIAIMSRFKAGGPYGDVLEKQLSNPKENTCFSIRSFTEDKLSGMGVMNRFIRQIITFDYVNEPGIVHAEKFRSPALEGYNVEEVLLHRTDFEEARRQQERQLATMESGQVTMGLEELFQTLNWSADLETMRQLKKYPKPNWLR